MCCKYCKHSLIASSFKMQCWGHQLSLPISSKSAEKKSTGGRFRQIFVRVPFCAFPKKWPQKIMLYIHRVFQSALKCYKMLQSVPECCRVLQSTSEWYAFYAKSVHKRKNTSDINHFMNTSCIKNIDLPKSDWIESRIVLTSYNADHFSLRISRQILPCWSTLGWKQGVINLTVGAV